MEILLTVAIPTYNRVESLKVCVARLAEQVKQFDCVEILVSDNCSQDATGEYMQTACEQYPFLRYIRNEENIGPDRNFLQCFEQARGKYALLLGDDDFLLEGALQSMLDSLKKNPVALFLNNSGVESVEPFQIGKPRMREEGEIFYNDRNDALQKMGVFITFMSAMVLKTELIAQIENKERYVNSYFIQSHIALSTMREEGVYIVNTKNCLAASTNERVGYDVYFVWFESFQRLFTQTATESGFDKKRLKKVYKKSIRQSSLLFVINFRRTCQNSKEWNKTCAYESVRQFPLLKLYAKTVMNCPKWMLPFFSFFHRVINKLFK